MCKHPNCGCADKCADANNLQVTERERRLEALLREVMYLFDANEPREEMEHALIRARSELAR
jgi:hypothetical protein